VVAGQRFTNRSGDIIAMLSERACIQSVYLDDDGRAASPGCRSGGGGLSGWELASASVKFARYVKLSRLRVRPSEEGERYRFGVASEKRQKGTRHQA